MKKEDLKDGMVICTRYGKFHYFAIVKMKKGEPTFEGIRYYFDKNSDFLSKLDLYHECTLEDIDTFLPEFIEKTETKIWVENMRAKSYEKYHMGLIKTFETIKSKLQ